MTALETHVRHASGALDLIDATGLVERTATEAIEGAPQPVTRPGPRPLIPVRPALRLTQAPRNLAPVPKAGRVVLLRDPPAEQVRVFPGGIPESDLEPPAESEFAIAGEISAGADFNPRAFSATSGSAARVPVEIHRSPRGVAGPSLSALMVFDDDAPASWAIVTVDVALGGGDPAARMMFRGQADRRGQARIPLPGIPLPTAAAIAAGTTALTATVTVRAARDASGSNIFDPDDFGAVEVRGPDAAAFAASAEFQLEPARPARLASFDGTETGDRLVLRQS